MATKKKKVVEAVEADVVTDEKAVQAETIKNQADHLTELAKEIVELKAERDDLDKSLMQTTANYVNANEQLESLKATLALVSEDRDLVTSAFEAFKVQHDSALNMISNLNADLDAAKAEIESLKVDLAAKPKVARTVKVVAVKDLIPLMAF